MPRHPIPSDRVRPKYPHLGQPEGQTTRAAAEWRRSNTYFIVKGEAIRSEVLADPLPCFTPKEWGPYVSSAAHEGYRMPNSPQATQRETPAESAARQQRAARVAACEDCMLKFQEDMGKEGRCFPPKYALTPIGRLLESEHQITEKGTHAAPRHGTEAPNVFREKVLPEREARQAGGA